MATTKTTTTTWAMRPSVRPTTASTTSETTTRATCTSPERARGAHSFTLDVVSHLFGSRSESHHLSSTVICMSASPWVDSPLLLPPLLPCLLFLPPPALRVAPWARQPDRHGKPVLLRQQKGSKDAYDVSTSLSGHEPNCMTFGELNDSSVPFSYVIPSSDQDMDDVTLGKLLTEAHRGQADYCEPAGVSVSQSVVVVWEKCRSITCFWCHKKPVQCS